MRTDAWRPGGSETSPDGRLRLDFLAFPDPRTEYELTGVWGVELIDLATGARIAEFLDRDYDWPAGGGIRFTLAGTRVTVAPDLKSFTAASDGDAVHPIGTLAAWAYARAEAARERAADRPPAGAGWPLWLALLAVIVVGGGFVLFTLFGVVGAIEGFLR